MNIEEIIEKLGPDYRVEEKDGVITVCDIWDGVEFAECAEYYKGSRTGNEIFQGHIYKITNWFKRGLIYFEGFEYGWPVEIFKPSTESAYVDQLKAKAHELYGEIKDGDRFVRGFHSTYNDILEFTVYSPKGYSYDITNDALLIDDMWVYHKGKWAKKIKSRVSVEVEDWVVTTNAKFESFDFSVEMRVKSLRPFDSKESAFYIAQCLEEYINKD